MIFFFFFFSNIYEGGGRYIQSPYIPQFQPSYYPSVYHGIILYLDGRWQLTHDMWDMMHDPHTSWDWVSPVCRTFADNIGFILLNTELRETKKFYSAIYPEIVESNWGHYDSLTHSALLCSVKSCCALFTSPGYMIWNKPLFCVCLFVLIQVKSDMDVVTNTHTLTV